MNRKNGKHICVEGNTRVALYKKVQTEKVKGMWTHIPALVYEEMQDFQIDSIRLQVHLVGTRQWDPYSKAKYLHNLRHDKNMPLALLVEYCGGREREIIESINAFSDMESYYRPSVQEGSFDTSRFSGFVELQKPNVKQAIAETGFTLTNFAEWIRDQKVYPLNTVRLLPRILRNQKARDAFLKYDARRAADLLEKPALSKALSDANLGQLAHALTQAIYQLPWLEAEKLRQDGSGETARRANFLAFNSPARIYLTHYEVLKSERKRIGLFLKTRRVGVILDEAHKIKNPDSELTQAMFELSHGFVRRVIMTGTPVANRPYDIWSQIFFLDEGASLGKDFANFRKDLDLSNDLARDTGKVLRFEKALAGLFRRIQPFSVRETKRAADIQLPEKQLRNVTAELEQRQAEIYDRFRDECAAIVVRDGVPEYDDAEEILKRLLRLIQVASNPKLVDDSYHAVPGKFPVLLHLVEDLCDRDEKAIIWTTFTENADWLARELRQFHAVKVHGKMSYDDRGHSLKCFKSESDCRLLIATPASSKEGLTLTVANNAIFYDRTFSLDDYLQAQDRIHRISQEKLCVVTNIVASGTVDEWVLNRGCDCISGVRHMSSRRT